ncbi:protein BLISTER-like [Nicotiana tomentosiformis]|uniref:protein BLISTER-like n=1 Tax=Nicotiana tomentosiformis TaxID=4098 RepID=UPI00051AD1F3|nr:protein BLISTER-like [Nicotiana tomentosiformis]
MASAQVLKKQEHLQAGKKKLEEFRKKRAAEKAKKSTPNSQQLASDGGVENQSSGNEHSRIKDSSGAGTSDTVDRSVLEPSEVHAKHDLAKPDITQKSDSIFRQDANAGATASLYKYNDDAVLTSAVRANSYDFGSSISALSHLEDKGSKSDENLKVSERVSDTYDSTEKRENDGALEGLPFGFTTNHSTAIFPSSSPNNDRISSQFTYDDLGKSISEENHAKDHSVTNDGTYHAFPENVSPSNSFGSHQDKPSYTDRWTSGMSSSSYGDYMPRATSVTKFYPEVGRNDVAVGSSNFVVPDKGYSQLSSSGIDLTKTSPWASDSKYDGFSFDARSSSSYSQMSPPTTGATGRRSPSFLDSINISKVSAASLPSIGSFATDMYDLVHPKDSLGSSNSENLTKPSKITGNGVDPYKHAVEKDVGNMDSRHSFYSQKQNEDFAALEQHIEDLTQEKFSLQRALEASRALAESLAAENSTLTDSYNQQGSFVAQLKAEMEKLQEEIKVHLGELEAVKMEYTNVQLECNAADERAKLLASEVIGLEEKALRLRSNELKLEKELEKSQAELSSFKKKISSLEKDRQDLQSTIDALKEEKKLLQSKFLKASANGKSVDPSRSMPAKIDVSTSTEDLCEDTIASSAINDPNLVGADGPAFSSLPDFGQLSLESLSLAIPADQIRMIQNINTLISELALEKDELTKALSVESSQSSKLKELNKDLTRKLEAQTQRLELLTAQSMANDNSQARQPDSVSVHDNMAYADEGDEVVERVLGWIMKLFPGGPSRRRTSKLL